MCVPLAESTLVVIPDNICVEEAILLGDIFSTFDIHTENQIAFSPTEAYNKNITYKIGRCPARFYLKKLISFMQKKNYNLAAVFSTKCHLKMVPKPTVFLIKTRWLYENFAGSLKWKN